MKEKKLKFDYVSPECETVSEIIDQGLCATSLDGTFGFEDFTPGDEFSF